MTETINDIAPADPHGCQIALNFTPQSVAYTYVAGLTLYSPANTFWAATGRVLTFSYTATFSNANAYVTEARWDMGDSTVVYGQTAVHTYLVANPHTQVSLQLKDNLGNYYYARKHVPLRDEPLVILLPAIGVAVT